MRKLAIIMVLITAACSSRPPEPPKIHYSEADREFIRQYEAIAPKSPQKVKLGKAYTIKDEWYFPMQQPSYNEEGQASWYGPGFDGKHTANGEIFNSKDYTAAHPSLPMPSIVEVTNLDNGRVVHVRVNDRGPFHSRRIIDVSRAAAEALDMVRSGTANVRVKLLTDQTLEYLQYAKTAENQ